MSFAALLAELVASARGARGAVFCGHDGEFVDLSVARPQPPGCGELSDFDLKIIGAQLAAPWLKLQQRSSNGGAGAPVELAMRCTAGTLLCARLPDGYYVVLVLAPLAHASLARFALRRATERLAQEI